MVVLKVPILLIEVVLMVLVVESQVFQPRPDCQDRCGDVDIPFPFGIGEECSLNSTFLVTCNSSANPPQLYLGNRASGFQITNITMEGQLHTLGVMARICYNLTGNPVVIQKTTAWMRLGKFSLYSSQNKFVVVGCDSYAYLDGFFHDDDTQVRSGCTVTCDSIGVVRNNTCTGKGCCQVDIPDGFKNLTLKAYSFDNHTRVRGFNPCTYAFVVQEDRFNFTTDLLNMSEYRRFPVVLEWALDNRTDDKARTLISSMCDEAHNSTVVKSDNVEGCRCMCSQGYEGNAYLEDGCQDTNECNNESLHDCVDNKHCANQIGSYECFCPKGYHGDGRKSGSRCTRNQASIILVVLGVTCGATFVFAILTFIYWRIQRRKINKRKEKFFIDNGGLMLQNLMTANGDANAKKVRIFKEDELKKATNKFDKSAVLGEGGFGTVYKGTLGNEVIAIKKSKLSDLRQIGQFVNEMMVLSQINHPNVVKLVGCCLETEVPLLVYEFIENKTLEHHILKEDFEGVSSLFPWEKRLRIAAETAGAIAHMHEPPRHIIHRDIKSANILLDDEFTAKVSDFGASRLVPLDQTQLTTAIQGTHGYLDPECFQTGLLNDKSDVYSFGVVLVELLTGETVLSFSQKNDKDKNNLPMHFTYTMKEDRLFDILDENMRLDEEIRTQVKGVAKVARQCLSPTAEKRPTMMQVKKWLEELRKDKRFVVKKVDFADAEGNFMESRLGVLHGYDPNLFEIGSSSSAISIDTLKRQALEKLPNGR